MAWASLYTSGCKFEGVSSTSGSALTLPFAASNSLTLHPGDVNVVLIACNNIATGADGDRGDISSVTDSSGNTYTVVQWTNGTTAVAGTATAGIAYSTLTTALTQLSSLTVNFSAAVVAKAAVTAPFTKGAGNTVSLTASKGLADDGAGPGAITITALASQEYLWLGAAAHEGDVTDLVTNDANHTLIRRKRGTTGGGGTSNMTVYGAAEIATGTNRTWDIDWASADHAQIYIALREKSTTPLPNVFDSVTVTESVTMQLNPLLYSVFDTVTVTEDVTMNLINMPNVFDGVTVTENVTVSVNHNITVSDDVTVTEAVTMNLLLQPNVFDTVTVTESVTALLTTLVPSVFDTVTVSESVTMNLLLQPVVFDGVTVTEAVSLAIALLPNVFDSVTVTEDTTVTLVSVAAIEINVNDTVAVADESTTLLPFLAITTSDDVTVSESVTVTETEDIAPSPARPDDGPYGRSGKRRKTIVKPTGLVDRPRKTVDERVEEAREIHQEALAKTRAEVAEQKPIAQMSTAEIDAEIGMYLKMLAYEQLLDQAQEDEDFLFMFMMTI